VGALAATLIARPGVPSLPLASLTLLLPFRPTKNVFCLGANYADHAKEGGHERPQAPIYFTKSAVALAGPYDDIEVDPTLTRNLDWEIELAVVVGRGGRHIPAGQALAHVFGYTVINDVSARDIQHSRGQWFLGKNLHRSSPIGPWVVTADEIPDPQKLDLELRVNGAVKQKTSTRNMIFSIVDAIVDLSRHLALESGDVIATGTCSGVGAARTPPEFLREGDLLETEIPAIGTLRNRIRERTPRESDR
jgi:2-keto-4-pentenoate hydratase/2-oxohepta-3-ene-1,7-dioic acid hydratase in catechol pathway